MTDNTTPSPDNREVHSQNNKALMVGVVCALLGSVGGYYINENNLLAKPGESGSSSGSLSSSQKTEVEGIVKQVIADNPDLLMASLRSMEKKMYEKQMAQASEGIKSSADELFNDKNSPVAGAEKPVITIVEFFDYHCGYCKKVSPTMAKVLENHKDVRIVFKEFPILSPDSRKAAQAAIAVFRLKPEKYFDYHQLLMEHRAEYNMTALKDYATRVGVDGDKLEKEMASPEIEAELKRVQALAGKMGIQGTPAIIVGDELIPGAIEYDALEFRIKAAKDMAGEKKE